MPLLGNLCMCVCVCVCVGACVNVYIYTHICKEDSRRAIVLLSKAIPRRSDSASPPSLWHILLYPSACSRGLPQEGWRSAITNSARATERAQGERRRGRVAENAERWRGFHSSFTMAKNLANFSAIQETFLFF